MGIVINDLIVKYKKQAKPALSINHLTIPSGIVAVIGENGAGKSTLFKCLQGFLLPESGTIVKSKNSDTFSSVQVFQSEQAFEHATVREWIEFQGLLRGIELSKEDISFCIEQAQLEGRDNHLVSRLSGGQQRKLNLLCAFYGNPDLLMLDEPTTGLDQEARKEYWNAVNKFLDRHSCTLLFSTHYMDEVEEHAQQVILLKRGEVVMADIPQKLIDNLQLSYVVTVPENKKWIFLQEKLYQLSEENQSTLYIRNADDFFLKYGSIEKLVQDGIQIRKPNMSDVYTLMYKVGKFYA